MRNFIGLALGDSTDGPPPAPRRGFNPDRGHPRPLKIVVVDDDKDTVKTLATILLDEGHDAWEVYQATEAMAIISRVRPDAVILDISMPKKTGYDIAKEIRAKYGKVHPLLIAVSGVYRKESDKLLSQALGFDHHLTKPCDPAELIALLEPLSNPG